MSHWENAAVGDLFEKIRTTMPQTNPGSLDTQTYLDIVAYLLRANGLGSAESKLANNPAALKERIRRVDTGEVGSLLKQR